MSNAAATKGHYAAEMTRNQPACRTVILLGLGRAGALALAALRRREDVKVVAAVDLDPETARAVPPDGVSIRRSLEALPPAEIVIVSTPTPSHRDVCDEVLARVPDLSMVLCEKPATLSVEDLSTLLESARGRGVELRVLLHYAFGSEVLWLTEHLHELGDVASFSASFEDPYGPALAERRSTLVSSWADSGINALTVLSRVLEPTAVVDSRATGLETSRTQLSFMCGETSGTGVVRTSWRVDKPRKHTSFTLVDGTVVDVDHLAASVTANGRLVHGPVEGDPAVMRYHAMIDAHLDDGAALIDETTTIHLHRLLGDGLTAQRVGRGT